jgi:hypothetical protein
MAVSGITSIDATAAYQALHGQSLAMTVVGSDQSLF